MAFEIKHKAVTGRPIAATDYNGDAHVIEGPANQILVTDGAGKLTGQTITEFRNSLGGSTKVDSASTRAGLKAINSNSTQVVLLQENGREGLFVWNPNVPFETHQLDTGEGIYVAPVAIANGAWVRQEAWRVNVEWFGISRNNSGAANSTAWLAMMSVLAARGYTRESGYRGLGQAFFPNVGVYNFASTCEIKLGRLALEGAGPHLAGSREGTVLKFPVGITGIRVHAGNTTGAISSETGTWTAGFSSIRNLSLEGSFSGTEAEAHGIQLRAMALIENVAIFNFQGDGVHINASVAATPIGNANLTTIRDCQILNNRNGVHLSGTDANVVRIIGGSIDNNRQWGVDDWSIGSYLDGVHFDANGHFQSGVGGSRVESWCWYNNNSYFVKLGQETWASTNPPSGTTADNQGWIWIKAAPGPVIDDGGWARPWTSGLTWRAGGSLAARSEGNTVVTAIQCYSENESNPQGAGALLVVGASMGYRGDLIGGSSLTTAGGKLRVSTRLDLTGHLNVESANTSTFAGPLSVAELLTGNLNLQGTGGIRYSGSLVGRLLGGGIQAGNNEENEVAFNKAFYVYNTGSNAYGMDLGLFGGIASTRVFAASNARVSFAGRATDSTTQAGYTEWGWVNSTEFNLTSGRVLKIAGTQVVGPRGASVADATDAASVITQLNALLSRMRAHGLIAP